MDIEGLLRSLNDHNVEYVVIGATAFPVHGYGPCGRQVHCAAAPPRQAARDLVTRDLPAAGFDSNTAFIIGNRLFYQGSGNIGLWYNCSCGVAPAARPRRRPSPRLRATIKPRSPGPR